MATVQQTFYNTFHRYAEAAAAGSKIFAETILAAAALESGYGKSSLASKYNNFFGIKAGSSWTGKKVKLLTTEHDSKGNPYQVYADFRVYDNPTQSFQNYVSVVTAQRYVSAGVLAAKNPYEQIAAIRKAGYATDVNYVAKITDILKKWISAPETAAGLSVAAIAIVFLLLAVSVK